MEQRNFIHTFIDEDIKEAKVDPDNIYTRFPPEPNGYLHIGHAKSICLNFTTAEKYKGRCNLRFDDTNPIKEDTEYVESIKEDVRWLGFEWDELRFASDYFEKMYECAIELIKKGKAYVDDLTPDEIRETRGTLVEPGKESPYKNRSIKENLKLFEEMKEGVYPDESKTLRANIDMASPNLNMRDPVIYRISHSIHHNTGDKWCVYPMYDFAHPLEDAIENITHSLCTLEFEDHRPLYDWFLQELEWKNPPRQIEFARLNLTNTIMSKRYLKALVDDGSVEGWDDPRMPTIAGIRRRGYTPAAIRKFADEIGVAKANSTVDMAFLEYCVREDIKDNVVSKSVVFDPIKIVITNYPEGKSEVLDMGDHEVTFSRVIYVDGDDFMEVPAKKYFRLYPGNEVRLRGAYFIKCEDVIKDEGGNIIELHCTYDPETKSGSGFTGRKVKGTIHWVNAADAEKVKVNEYGYLMIENEEGEQVLNPDSKKIMTAFAEPSINDIKDGERLQFFRRGYYIREGDHFNQIVSLKSSWKPDKGK